MPSPVVVRSLNLEGDQQSELTVHGGESKAVYASEGWNAMTRRDRVSAWLALRSVTWALLPLVVAGYVPWRFFGLSGVHVDAGNPVHLIGLILMAVGATLLLACIREFAVSGHGTLSPVDPPKALVVRGLYRYVRNPMYLSVATLLIGESLLVQSVALLTYFLVWFAFVNVFVLAYEEPALRGTFGASYQRYTQSVGRWLPSFRSRHR